VASIRDLEAAFPRLAGTNYSEESDATDFYNCIAYAFGETDNWWWPRRGYGTYWPPGFPLNDAVDTLVQIFENRGYSRCEGREREAGYEKVAIYCRDGRIKHAARQPRSGAGQANLGKSKILNMNPPNTWSASRTEQ
jgi:hypothetical protein